MVVSVTPDMRDTIRSAAAKLTGYRRRQFQAEMAVKYCDSSARAPSPKEYSVGDAIPSKPDCTNAGPESAAWNGSRNGRSKKTEDIAPEIVTAIRRLVEPRAQMDPTFESPLAFTCVTAQAVRDELLKDPAIAPHVPCRQTIGNMLNRLDYRLRPVIKAHQQKKLPRPTPSSTTSTPPANEPGLFMSNDMAAGRNSGFWLGHFSRSAPFPPEVVGFVLEERGEGDDQERGLRARWHRYEPVKRVPLFGGSKAGMANCPIRRLARDALERGSAPRL